MRKKFFGIIFASLLVFSIFGQPAMAGNCGCHEDLQGAEKNKEVSNLLKSDDFKVKKQELLKSGYQWQGVNITEVIKSLDDGTIVVGVLFVTPTGQQDVFFFLNNGMFLGSMPLPV
jgi:hypothetical protein